MYRKKGGNRQIVVYLGRLLIVAEVLRRTVCRMEFAVVFTSLLMRLKRSCTAGITSDLCLAEAVFRESSIHARQSAMSSSG
jgi:hypothetical protein